MRPLVALLLLIALPLAATAQPGAPPVAQRHLDPDSLVIRAYRALVRDEVLHSRFRVTASGDSYGGLMTTYTPPPDGVFHYRFDFDDPSLGGIAADSRALQHRYARNRRIYVDSTGSSIGSTAAALFVMYPSVSTTLFDFHDGAESKTYVGRDTTGGRACQRTRVVGALRDDGSRLTILPCYDDETALPHHIVFDLERPDGREHVELQLSESTWTPGAPADTTFTFPLPDDWQYRAYDGSDRPALLAAGSAAPDFTLVGTDGAPVHLADLRGRIVLLDFWATWCPPCIADIPAVQALADAHADLAVVGVASFEEPDADPEAVAREHGARYRIAFADEATLAAYRVEAVPAYVLIGRDGTILYSALHDDDDQAVVRLTSMIRSLTAR